MSERIRIPFHIQPYKFEKGMHVVEKADSQGRKRRYLKGITSGIKIDGHGERMTKACVEKMQNQANSGEILLYEGQHGVTHTADLGRLTESQMTPTGDWITLYRLYDQYDEVGPVKLERADTLWKQVNGLPPYEKKLQKGFSIEGYIPDEGIVEMSETGQRVIDNVELDGVLVTPRPSYKSSVISAVYKALDELPPDTKLIVSENIRGKFINKLHDEALKQSYYSKRFKLEDALNESIEEIVSHGVQIKDRLELLLDEYKRMLIDMVVEHNQVFIRPQDQPDIPDGSGAVDVAKAQQTRVLKSIHDQLQGLVALKMSKLQKSKQKENRNGNTSKRGIKPRRKAGN
jgi:hypothetical protein